MVKRKRFGEILIEAGIITDATLQAALVRQKACGKRIGQILEETGKITEKAIAIVLARQFGLKTVKNLAARSCTREVLSLIDRETAFEHLVFPLKREHNVLFVAITNPLDLATLDSLTFRTGLKIVTLVTTPSEIQGAIRAHYDGGGGLPHQDEWTVLVVDDQEFFRTVTSVTLEKEGYAVLQAKSGLEALKLAREHSPQLILLDMIMPRMDGPQTFRELQVYQDTRRIPVIAMTARATPEQEAAVLQAGYFDFIAKPINPLRLTARVNRAIHTVYGPAPWKNGQPAGMPSELQPAGYPNLRTVTGWA
ncbi:two-component system response regulator [Desulfuromonas versatilis]|uniref:Two-component system response regulator n=1 Tax=Desulfuromonas versatilis TaxID=2802975 RepID=A0ABN6DST4_9BACT|nr:response regulator [Desulfuromonas versatilis]BCR03225.1 two-component system response regulator [Desulfuromonas versatilis]